MSRLKKDFNSHKNNILNNRKENKPNQKPRSQQSSFKSPPRIKQVWMRKIGLSVKFVSPHLKLDLLVSGTLIVIVVDI